MEAIERGGDNDIELTVLSASEQSFQSGAMSQPTCECGVAKEVRQNPTLVLDLVRDGLTLHVEAVTLLGLHFG